MTGLADCNNFFVSCERSVNPELNGKAVVVLSNNDGCAIARSNEAKRLGVAMGQPAFELRDMIRKGRLIALSGNHTLYHDISVRIHEIFRRYVPHSIDYSVDEAFLDFSGIPSDAISFICQNIIKDCMTEEKIPVTIGVSYTKTLAKMASSLGKQRALPYVVLTDNDIIRRELSGMSIKDVWGIGRRLAKKLYISGVYTAADFVAKDKEYIRLTLGVNGEKSWRELQGIPCIDLSRANEPLQDSISETRTFPMDVDDYNYVMERISLYTVNCAARLRKMNGVCKTISVFLRTNRFHKEETYQPQISVQLPTYTNDSNLLVNAAQAALKRIFLPGISYKRAGVEFSDIKLNNVIQPSLFDDSQSDAVCSNAKLMSVIDNINDSLPQNQNQVVRIASQIISNPIRNDGFSSSFQFKE